MRGTIRTRTGAVLVVVCAATIALGVTAAAQGGSTSQAVSRCSIVVSGAPWRIRAAGTLSGHEYTVSAHGMPCSTARSWVLKFTSQHNPGIGQALKGGPSGFSCRSWTTPASGAKLVVAGACMRPPHNNPFFGWAPKVR
jgi:hypothetical protein